jgi:DNA-binding PadR family transcriptional regulator
MEDVPLARKERRLYERWVKGLAPLLALLCLRDGNEMTGYDLIKFIYQHFGVLLSPGTMYPILHSLQRNGVVTEQVQGMRKAYAIAGNGSRALRDVRLPFVRGQSVLMSLLNYEDESASEANLLEKRTPLSELPAIYETAIQRADEPFPPSSLEDALQSKLTQFPLVPEARHIAVRAEETLDYARNLTAHDHAVLFYESLEEKWRVISSHLSYAWENGNKAVYVCCFEEPDQVREGLKQNGIDVPTHERHGRFTIWEWSDYLKREEFEQIDREVRVLYEELVRENRTIRAAADLTFVINNQHAEKLLKYERWIGRRSHWPVAGICAYNSAAVTGVSDDLFLELLKLHGHAIFPGIALEL